MGKGSHHSNADPRNQDIKININGELFHRDEAKISVFDSGFILGDGVWEGLRLHHGKLPFIDKHMRRLYEGAKALDMDIGISKEELIERIITTCNANDMHDHVHIRLMVSRGVKSTPYQDPRVTISSATIVIIPEYKMPAPETADNGLNLYTVYVRRGYPDVQDQKLNSHSKLNCIFGCIQATKAGADEALMLDPHGFVSTCNSTHFFIVRDNQVWTSTGDYCLSGITRSNIIDLCKENGIEVYEKNFTLSEVYGAEEAFVTGTFAGVTPVQTVDGREIGEFAEHGKGAMVQKLQQLYLQRIAKECPHE
ncbi:aminotransferase class IV [Thalassotalea sp. Y01]|uniref:aminotransferase class IV n=1 Tax=Thalassotalea sp. Y01 TaxID=2729613 RepID=UPI00145DA0A8|nr:aminotransferase class IV [Thalassotalea sp. Y01]NMP16146.1 aminotransferase class IV [Thalassotalea sp. Y01]